MLDSNILLFNITILVSSIYSASDHAWPCSLREHVSYLVFLPTHGRRAASVCLCSFTLTPYWLALNLAESCRLKSEMLSSKEYLYVVLTRTVGTTDMRPL